MLLFSVYLCIWGSLYNTFENGLSVDATEINLDSKVADFVKKYLPLNHKPDLIDNTVYVMADLYNIIDLDEVSETITTKLWVYIAYLVAVPEDAWTDIGPEMYQIFPGANKIWLPDIIILNKVETKAISGADPVVNRNYCCDDEDPTLCEYCGALVVFPASRTEVTTCNIDVVDFPFDSQNCVISIGPWFTDITSPQRYVNADGQEMGPYRIEIVSSQTKMSLISYEENSQWELLGAPVVSKTRVAQHDYEKTFELFEYTLQLRRKPRFFIYTLILPCFCLTSLTVLSVLVPVESGEKMGLGVTVLLAQIVNLLILTSFLPASSQYFPYLGFYVLMTIILISICLVYNAIIINIYYHGYWGVLNLIKKKTKVGPASVRFSATTGRSDLNELVTKMEQQSKNTETAEQVENCSPEEEELRKKRCIVADHVFAVIIFVADVIVHLSFFCPYM